MCTISGVSQGNVRATERYMGSYLCNYNCAFIVDGLSNDANEEEKELMDGGCGMSEHYCCDCCGEDYLQNKMLMLAEHLIANGVTVHEWISTKDRLPEKDVDVLVCDRHNNVFIAAVCESQYFSSGLSWRDQTGYLIGNLGIIRWQPLPKPTKEE